MLDHAAFMQEALALAERGRGWVSPNPMVGALVVREGQIIGRGWHQQYGGPHAEVFALREAGEAARGAALYCTLEPCNHTGKTPPCAQAVLKAGIRTVILGARDPNPVAAGGCETLRAAGVGIITGVLEEPCKLLNAPFFKTARTGVPFVTLKWAMTLDGKIATASGDSKWISSEESRRRAHLLRAEHDAVLVGIKTLLADESRLSCRIAPLAPDRPLRQPLRVILDSQARTPLDAPLWTEENAGPVVICCAESAPEDRRAALEARGAALIATPAADPLLPLPPLLKALRERGVRSILAEGGSDVLGSFLDAGLADAVQVFIAPKLLGGQGGLSPLGGTGRALVANCIPIRNQTTQALGSDTLISGRIGEWDWLV